LAARALLWARAAAAPHQHSRQKEKGQFLRAHRPSDKPGEREQSQFRTRTFFFHVAAEKRIRAIRD
jgi:hypothetical protein